ncbi:thiosulfate sulfurtransferase-like [Acropora millepora]|uniref:thiosulfate sulfurtransferase-like n=1 Tax=Acropora millepora TaxID=45264 RepID=UPI001CF33B3E|nr:thiosulfate sulfurtransferase-like [Acropora millepora]
MDASRLACIVSVDWLHKKVESRKSDHLAVLDTTWFSDKDAIEDFSKQHIIHASHMDVFLGVETQPLYPRNIPDEAIFELIARGSAVNSSDHVIIYENTGKFGFFLGARAWWLFKLYGHENVSVLDGGLEKWISSGFETTNMMMKKKEGDFTAKLNSKWIVKFEDMVENLTSRKAQVCDSRVPEKFQLSSDDPGSGHYPGAVNIPFSSLFNLETRTLKSIDELKKVFSDAGVDLSKPVICMCFGGMSSCSLLLAAHLCGCPDTALYLGSFSEWKGRADPTQIE